MIFQSFEALNQRAVAVVVDPIQSVKGKVVIDAFRLINPQTMMLGQEPRQTTSNLGHLNKPSIQVSHPLIVRLDDTMSNSQKCLANVFKQNILQCTFYVHILTFKLNHEEFWYICPLFVCWSHCYGLMCICCLELKKVSFFVLSVILCSRKLQIYSI